MWHWAVSLAQFRCSINSIFVQTGKIIKIILILYKKTLGIKNYAFFKKREFSSVKSSWNLFQEALKWPDP